MKHIKAGDLVASHKTGCHYTVDEVLVTAGGILLLRLRGEETYWIASRFYLLHHSTKNEIKEQIKKLIDKL